MHSNLCTAVEPNTRQAIAWPLPGCRLATAGRDAAIVPSNSTNSHFYTRAHATEM